MQPIPLRTTVIGSYPFPSWLEMASGQLDPSFSHNDWAFAHSPGRLSYDFPPVVQQIEQQLKAAKDSSIQQGNATEKRGKPFWTIRAPKTPVLPF